VFYLTCIWDRAPASAKACETERQVSVVAIANRSAIFELFQVNPSGGGWRRRSAPDILVANARCGRQRRSALSCRFREGPSRDWWPGHARNRPAGLEILTRGGRKPPDLFGRRRRRRSADPHSQNGAVSPWSAWDSSWLGRKTEPFRDRRFAEQTGRRETRKCPAVRVAMNIIWHRESRGALACMVEPCLSSRRQFWSARPLFSS